MKKKLSVFFLYFFLIVYLEFINKIVMFNKLPDINFFVVLLFSVSLAFLCSFVSVLGKEKTNKRITFALFLLITAFYLANFLYYSLFSLPFSIRDLELVSNALSFYEIGLHLINTDFIPILLFLLPFFVFLLYKKDFDYEKKTLNKNALNFIGTFAFYILALLGLNLNKEELYSPYHLYYNLDAITKSTEVLGLFTSQRINFKRYLFGFQEKIVAEKSIPVQDDQVEYNKLDIDFDTLIANEKNPEIKQIYEYLKNKKATNKNEYTGMYKGKNLIFILAEGFNSIAVDEQRTPTLYKLIHEGFDFSNYYSPEFLSTTGGEFQAMTGLLPTQEILSIWRNQHPLISYAIGNSFKKYGYNTFSYHNWYYKYYNRNVTMPTLGFNNFMACQNGMEKKINCSWLPSDIDLINATFPLLWVVIKWLIKIRKKWKIYLIVLLLKLI